MMARFYHMQPIERKALTGNAIQFTLIRDKSLHMRQLHNYKTLTTVTWRMVPICDEYCICMDEKDFCCDRLF